MKYKKEIKKLKEIIPEFIYDIVDDWQNMYVAGGAITSIFTNKEVNDLDFYFTSKKYYTEILDAIISNSTIVSVTEKSILVNHSGQLLNFILFDIFESANDIFNKFDFTVVMGAYNIKKDKLILHDDFLLDVAKRKLVFNNGTLYPILSLLRVNKYVKRGYTISRNDMVRIALTISELNISSYEELSNHIGGMYGVDIEKIVDVSKPFRLVDIVNELSELETNYEHYNLVTWNNKESIIKDFITKFKLKNTINITQIKNKYFILTTSHHIQEIDKNDIPTNYKHIITLEDEHYIYLYKYVNNKENKLVSFHDSNFEYKLQQQITSKHSTKELYGGFYSEKHDFSYCKENTKVLLKLKVKVKDIIKIRRTEIEFKTCFVEKIVMENDNDKIKMENDLKWIVEGNYDKSDFITKLSF